MAKDWSEERSPTVQAAENLAATRAAAIDTALVAQLRKDIDAIETVLDELNGVGTHNGKDDDLFTAVRSLGAYQAMLKRRLYVATAN